jgi:hypothetical protein
MALRTSAFSSIGCCDLTKTCRAFSHKMDKHEEIFLCHSLRHVHAHTCMLYQLNHVHTRCDCDRLKFSGAYAVGDNLLICMSGDIPTPSFVARTHFLVTYDLVIIANRLVHTGVLRAPMQLFTYHLRDTDTMVVIAGRLHSQSVPTINLASRLPDPAGAPRQAA